MKPSIKELVEHAPAELTVELKERLDTALRKFGVKDKDRKIKFTEFENPTLAVMLCYDILAEESKNNKSYFCMPEVVTMLYRSMSRSIKSASYLERDYLQELKVILSDLTFNHQYYSNEFGFRVSGIKFSGYIFDDSMGSAKTKVSSMIKAKMEFERFTLSERGSMEFDFNIPNKEMFEEYPHLKNELIDAANCHNLPELNKVIEEYGYGTNPHAAKLGIQSSSLFGG